MTTFAPAELTGRRPDQPGVALFFQAPGPVVVDDERPFVRKVGRRYQSGSLVRLGALFTATEPVSVASLSIAFGNLEGRLLFDGGMWTVVSPDAEGLLVPIADGDLLEGVEYAVSLTVDVGAGEWRDVIVDGRKVAPQVVDLIPGPQPADEVFVVDLGTGGPEPVLPEWVQVELESLGAEELFRIGREHGGRVELTRTPEPDVERVPRPAPLSEVDSYAPFFTFAVEASSPLTVSRAWAVEA